MLNQLTNRITKETVFQIDDNVFDQIVNEVYGKTDFSFVASEEMSNDTAKSFDVEKEPLDKWDQEILDEFIKGNRHQWVAAIIFNDLCNKGIIEEGEYIVYVSW